LVYSLNTAAVKQNVMTKDHSKKAVEDELSTWFGNSRDRGEGGRKNVQRCQKENQQPADDSDNLIL
jgi:hypothetical protein